MSKFPWGKRIDLFCLDFDGKILEVTKFHPNQYVNGASSGIDESVIRYHSEELAASSDSLDELVISWIARRRLGLNQHQLIAGICRALEIK